MLNDSTLTQLNRLGFGLYIDKIETYIANYKEAQYIGNGIENYKYNYEELKRLLSALKPTSRVLTDEELDTQIYDNHNKIFKLVNNDRSPILYGRADDDGLEMVKNSTLLTETDIMDLVGIEYTEGLNVSCTYKKGILEGIYGLSKENMICDFTEKLKGRLKHEIEALKEYDLVDIRGIITIENRYITTNAVCDTAGIIRAGIGINKLRFIANDIFLANVDNNDGELSTVIDDNTKHYWKKLSFIKNIGLDAPEYSLLRNIDDSTFTQAVYTFADSFASKGIIRFKVKNIRDTSNISILTYEIGSVDSSYVFESVITGISMYEDTYKLNIVNTECNFNLHIDNIILDDVFDIEKYKLRVGGKVRFRVIERRAILEKQ
jgi:hypothetical protein